MNDGTTISFKVHVARGPESRLELREGTAPPAPPPPPGRVPRIARLMALAIRFDALIRGGQVRDQAELARLGRVTRARVTQIMNLLNLAPDLQEALLNLPRVEQGCDPIGERDLRPVAAQLDWRSQRRMWRTVSGPVS
jgi:hypothetical protein